MGKNRTKPKAQNDLEALLPLDAGSSARGNGKDLSVLRSVKGSETVGQDPGFQSVVRGPWFLGQGFLRPPFGQIRLWAGVCFAPWFGALPRRARDKKELVSTDALRCEHRGPFPAAKAKGFLRVS